MPATGGFDTFYGLRENPFESQPDIRFLFRSASFDRAVEELLAAIGRHEGVLALTGSAGIGKTTTCQFLPTAPDRHIVVAHVSELALTVDDLLKAVLVAFGVVSKHDLAGGRLTTATHEDLTKALREFLASLTAVQATAVVLIDDAEVLSLEVMQYVRVLSEVAGSQMQVVLVGTPDLLAVLDQYELRQLSKVVRTRISLEPLSADEVRPYVLCRLAVVNPNVALTFDPSVFQRLFTLSRGNPKAVNLLCARALALGSQRSAAVIDASMIGEAVNAADLPALGSALGGGGILRTVLIAVCLGALACVGAAGAAWVFRERFSLMVDSWRAVPVPPTSPVPLRSTPFGPPEPPPDKGHSPQP